MASDCGMQARVNGFRAPLERGLDETITGLFLQLNGRGRTCTSRKAAMHGAAPFATSPALLQSAALGAAGRCHPNPGLARSSQRPGLTPAGRWPTMHPWFVIVIVVLLRAWSVVSLLQKPSTCWAARVPIHRTWHITALPKASAAPKVRRTQPRARWRSHRRPGFPAHHTPCAKVAP